MPVYVVGCDCGHRQDIFRKIDDRDSELPQHCGRVMARKLTAPMVAADIQPYRSMIDGSIIGSRSKHRTHLKDHGMIEMGNEQPKAPGPLKTPAGLKDALIRAYDQHSTT